MKMNARRLASALSLGALFALNAHAANLLTNPGAETGDISGWTVGTGDAIPGVDDGSFDPGISPHSGTYDFYGHNGAVGTLTQIVSLTGIPDAETATVSFWEQGLNQGAVSDNGFVSLTFYGAADGVLGTAATAVIDSHGGTWQNFTGSFAIPTGTTSIGYTMNFTRHVGSDLDTFIDDNSLTVSAVPEPANLALLASGLLALGLRARRRR